MQGWRRTLRSTKTWLGLALLALGVAVVAVEANARHRDERAFAAETGVLSKSAWDLDEAGARRAARILVQTGRYERLEVTSDTGAQLASEEREPSAGLRLLGRLGLTPTRSLNAPLRYEGHDVGEVRAVLRHRRPLGYLAWLSAVLGAWAFVAQRLQLSERGAQLERLRAQAERAVREDAERRLDERERQLLESRRMEELGKLAGGIAHDFNNLLTVILGGADLLREDLEEGPRRQRAADVVDAAQRAAGMTRQLLAFSSRQPREPRLLDVNDVVQGMGAMLGRLLPDSVDLQVDLGRDLGALRADPAQLEQIVLNLVVNARDAMPEGGKLLVRTKLGRLGDAPAIALEVSDGGVGMDAATRRKVFEPFFTTKVEGTGLGLSTVYGIVRQSGGRVDIDSEPGLGTAITVLFPRDGEAGDASALTAEIPVHVPQEVAALVVDDQEVVRSVVSAALRAGGATVHEAADVPAALEAARGLQELDLLVTDLNMPGGDGLELAGELRRLHPRMHILLVSGSSLPGSGLPDGARFLAKPFTAAELRRAVARLLR